MILHLLTISNLLIVLSAEMCRTVYPKSPTCHHSSYLCNMDCVRDERDDEKVSLVIVRGDQEWGLSNNSCVCVC